MSPLFRQVTDPRGEVRLERIVVPNYHIHYEKGRLLWTVLDGYREMRPSEPRHHWIRSDVNGLGAVAMCFHCGLLMRVDGKHSRTCYGRGRP